MKLSRHAITRAHERIWPALERDRVREELTRLAAEATRVTALDWHQTDPEETPDYYLVISDGIALPVIDGVAVTCVTRAGLPEGHRRFRVQKRKQRARHKREAALNKNARAASRARGRRRAEDEAA